MNEAQHRQQTRYDQQAFERIKARRVQEAAEQEVSSAKRVLREKPSTLESATGKLVCDALWNSGLEPYPGPAWVEKIQSDPELVKLLEFAGTLGCRFGMALQREAENPDPYVTGIHITDRQFVELVSEVKGQNG